MVLFLQDRGLTWRARLTWRVGQALRPRGRAAHGPSEVEVARGWPAHVARGHTSPRGCPEGRDNMHL